MLSLWSWLLVALLGALLAEESEGAGICGKLYSNVQVRPLDIKLLHNIEGLWYVVAAYESEPRFFNNVQCMHYHYQVTEEPNVINATKYERLINQTRFQIEIKMVFEQTNNSVADYINMQPGLSTLLEYNVNAPCDNDNVLIFYTCVPGGGQKENYTVFYALSREYSAKQTPTVTAAIKEAKDRVGLQEEKTKSYYNKDCGVEDPIWTTTPSE